MKRPEKFLGIALITILLTACTAQKAESPPAENTHQASLCEVNSTGNDVVARQCKPGQKVVFLPSSWGNEQLPVIFAALHCDLRYSVLHTNGGVTCIYGPSKLQSQKEPDVSAKPK